MYILSVKTDNVFKQRAAKRADRTFCALRTTDDLSKLEGLIAKRGGVGTPGAGTESGGRGGGGKAGSDGAGGGARPAAGVLALAMVIVVQADMRSALTAALTLFIDRTSSFISETFVGHGSISLRLVVA